MASRERPSRKRRATKGFEVVSEAEERALSQALKASLNTVPDAATPFPFDAARPQSFGHAGGSSSGGGKFKSSSSGGSKAKSHKAKAKGGGASVAKSHKRASSASSNNADSPLQQAIRASLVEAQLAAEERAAALSEGAGPSSSSRDRKGKGPAGHHQQQEQQPGYTSTSTSTSSTNNQPPNSTSAASPPLPKSNFPTHESGNVIVRPKGFREFGEASTLVGTFKCTAAEVVTFFSDGSNDPYRYLQAEKVLGMQAPTPEMVAEAAAEKRKAATPSSRSATPSSHHGGGGGGAKSPNQRKPSSSSGGGGGEAAEGASAGERKEKRRRTSKTQAFDLTDAPVYRPSATEFSEPLDYIASIRDEAQKYGICRIIPPKQWQPSFQLDPTNFKFNTRKQRIHQLYTRFGPNCQFIECLKEHLLTENTDEFVQPVLGSMELDLFQLSKLVNAHGGLQTVINKLKWGKIADELKIPKSVQSRNERLQAFYYRYLLSYDMLQAGEKAAIQSRVLKKRDAKAARFVAAKTAAAAAASSSGGSGAAAAADVEDDEAFGFESGKSHNLTSFRKMADDFKETYLKNKKNPHEANAGELEAEYWKILEDGDKHVCVSYGSDVDTTKHGSGFSVSLDDPYSKFGWNLNVLPGLEGSILKHVSGISGISMPWLYVGMMFSTFCWHNEDNYLYSINYHHFGAPKMWYGVPGEDAHKLEACFAKYMPDEFGKRPLLLHDLVTMLSPARLAQDGIRVSRTVQEQRQFVVTFPQAYHSGFSLGFNCGEAVNFAAADWIPFGLKAVEDYAKQKRPVSLDQEQLLVNTARLEKNPKTLSFVIPQLIEIRDREELLRERLQSLGVAQTTFEAMVTKLQGQPASDATTTGGGGGLGNIFQPRAKMGGGGSASSGGGMFAGFSDGSGAAEDRGVRMSGFTATGASTGRMGGNGDAEELNNTTCMSCRRICYLSVVQIDLDKLQPSSGNPHQGIATRCLSCTLNGDDDAVKWKTAPGGAAALTLTVRFPVQVLDKIIDDAQERADR